MRATAGKSNLLKTIALYRRTVVQNETKDSVQKEKNLKYSWNRLSFSDQMLVFAALLLGILRCSG